MQRKLALKTGLSMLAAASLLAIATVPAQAQRGGETAPPAETRSSRTWIVQLADAPLATYDGQRAGLAATRPAPGQRLDLSTSAARAYQAHLDSQRAAVLARLPGVRAVYNYSVTFNGFAAVLTPEQAADLARLPQVRQVVPSEIRQLDTTRTTEFIGVAAPGGVHSMTDAQGRNVRGEDVILGIVDSGIWPESPAFSDKIGVDGLPVPYHQPGTVVYGPAPAGWNGGCATGEGFNPSMCNNKLIGARVYGADFTASGAVRAALEYNSPREGATSGHGTHTASTAGGNNLVPIRSTVNNVITGFMSGVAPRARIAAYKVCWTATVSTQTGCYTGDMLAAIDQAVADGVHVINFSISGTQLNFLDPVEQAFLAASNAGVFVSASAGNSGPGNTVAHMSPWLITVGNSTHDRSQGGSITLGNGTTLTGGSTNFIAAPTAGLVLSNTIPADGQTATAANNCLANSLSSAAAGKIVVCAVGTNTQAARLAMGAEVARAGGVGMVITAAANANDPHTLPAVQLATANGTTLRDYVTAQGAAATGALSLSINLPGVIAPVMSNSSSRGPNRANPDILKPDITGPGSSVIASGRPTLSVAQRNEVVAGTLIPPWGSATLSGTSMSSPHVAGSAALLRQMFPTWSPAAIKSALMTNNTGVRLSSGATDTNRWGYGSGHLNPNGAIVPSLVYDAGAADYGRFLCGIGLASPASIGSCATLGSVQAHDLNLPSLTASAVVGQRTLTRTVRNVGPSTATFVASASLPGYNVVVNPSTMTLAPGASATYTATLQRTTAALNTWVFGNLAWSDGVRTVTSPLSARALSFAAPVETSAVSGGRNTRAFSVQSLFTGTLEYAVAGLVPADARSATISTGQTQCYNYTVPAGAAFARFATFNSDTQGGALTDLDIEVFSSANCTGTNVGTAAAGGSDEMVTLDNPAAGNYSVRVTGYATAAGGAAYTLSTWIVGPGDNGNLRIAGPSAMAEGGTGTVGYSWTVTPGARYMASIAYRSGGNEIGRTKLLVDAR